MCTVKKEINIGADYEVANRHSSDKLLSEIYCRRQNSIDSMLTSGSNTSSSSSNLAIVSIHDELAQLRAQISHLQRTVDQLPARICALLKPADSQQKQQQQQNSQSSSFTMPTSLTVMDIDGADDDFDKLSSGGTSVLSDIEILNESIDDNNRDLLAWCRRLQIDDDINNHISVEPEQKQPEKEKESRFESNLFSEWERRYSIASQKHQSSIVKCTSYGVPTLIPNYSSEVDKNIWLK